MALALSLAPAAGYAELAVPPNPKPRTRPAPPPSAPVRPGTLSLGSPEPYPEGDAILGGGYNVLTGSYLPGVCVQRCGRGMHGRALMPGRRKGAPCRTPVSGWGERAGHCRGRPVFPGPPASNSYILSSDRHERNP